MEDPDWVGVRKGSYFEEEVPKRLNGVEHMAMRRGCLGIVSKMLHIIMAFCLLDFCFVLFLGEKDVKASKS